MPLKSREQPGHAADVAALGVTGVFTNLPAYARGYPTIGFQNLACGGSPGNNPSTSDIPMWEYADSLTMVKGQAHPRRRV